MTTDSVEAIQESIGKLVEALQEVLVQTEGVRKQVVYYLAMGEIASAHHEAGVLYDGISKTSTLALLSAQIEQAITGSYLLLEYSPEIQTAYAMAATQRKHGQLD
jgi:adenylate kinase family enzyme